MTRWFADPCLLPHGEHRTGDRHWQIGAPDMELVGHLWTRVCPPCDKPMTEVRAGVLACSCGSTYDTVPARTVPPEEA